MTTPTISTLRCSCAASADANVDGFLECLKQDSSISSLVYTPTNPSYQSVLDFSIRNKRFLSNSTPKPLVIITPEYEHQIPHIICCAKQNQLQIRTRSGGHDFEGLSYVSEVPFVIIDLLKLSEVTVDAPHKTAWVGAGATLGIETPLPSHKIRAISTIFLGFQIKMFAIESPRLGFPGGFCPTVGLGGHISGGGWGVLFRKYSLAADNVLDARIVDVNGRILDRDSMGEDLFWAIRGGGGSSFGVILAWKVRLVDVPERVTVFKTPRDSEKNATQLIHRWQYVAPNFEEDLFLRVLATRITTSEGMMTIRATFNSVFLGGIDRLLALMQEKFPELCLEREEFQHDVGYYKGKSDYVQEPIPIQGFEGVWRLFYEPEAKLAEFLLTPYGGRMAEIPDNATPFPHRAGNLYKMHHMVFWEAKDADNADKYISWVRKLSDCVTPYVTKSPRGAYFDYRDLDIGVNNNEGPISVETARVWGEKYFKNNFDRLVQVKNRVDPENFFREKQTIPPQPSSPPPPPQSTGSEDINI
ncbi:UNVERIFIED_CONTAM: Berberine bridge enzyme-like 27 [Sesamum angustifolium]|uniref:Berberine bridge enzyme-like 27 n=1 Tax=Sesamum angustifolium TaxID=2727405 RepID=A0AAW2J2E4_9LAMI